MEHPQGLGRKLRLYISGKFRRVCSTFLLLLFSPPLSLIRSQGRSRKRSTRVMFPQFSRSLKRERRRTVAGITMSDRYAYSKMALPGQGVARAYCWPSTFQENAADCANRAHVQLRDDTMKPALMLLSTSGLWEKLNSSREYLPRSGLIFSLLFFFFLSNTYVQVRLICHSRSILLNFSTRRCKNVP